jgi:hypothetical protein
VAAVATRKGIRQVTYRRICPPLALALLALIVSPSTAARAAVIADSGTLGFQVYTPPAPLGTNAEEPSIGNNHLTDTTMYQSGLQTLQVKFNDATTPATATWKDVSSTLTSITSLDPILFTDSELGRTWVSQLTGQDSLSEYTNDDGASYTPALGGGFPSGPDHQSIGAGPYNPLSVPPQGTVYANAVYYCSQAVLTAFCARSDNGGLTYGAGVPIYSFDQCGGLHGHVRVTPNGVDMVPNQNCDKQLDPGAGANQQANGGTFPYQAVVTSVTNGATWTVQTIPDSHASLRSDPSVAADKANNVFFGYEDAVTNSGGTQVGGLAKIATATINSSGTFTWSPSVDVGAVFGIKNVQFPEVIAGDSGRAAYAFLGSTTGGNPEDTAFTGVWNLYVAITTDGGANYTVTDVTPGDPVERGCTYLAGNGTCPSSKRNLLDFMDVTVDKSGRTLVGYADGCTTACDQGQACNAPLCDTGAGASTAREAQIARLQCGVSLYAKFDNTYACGSAVVVPESSWGAALLVAGAAAGVPLLVRRRRREVRFA